MRWLTFINATERTRLQLSYKMAKPAWFTSAPIPGNATGDVGNALKGIRDALQSVPTTFQ